MARKRKLTLQRKRPRKKHKGQAPPKPLPGDESVSGKSRRRRRNRGGKKNGRGDMGNRGKIVQEKEEQPEQKEEISEASQITAEDIAFIGANSASLQFLQDMDPTDLQVGKNKKKQKREKPTKKDEEDVPEFEQAPRTQSSSWSNENQAVSKLPVKSKEGEIIKKIIGPKLPSEEDRIKKQTAPTEQKGKPMETNDDEESEESDDEEKGLHEFDGEWDDSKRKKQIMKELQPYMLKRGYVKRKKETLALIGTEILANPERNLFQIKQLLEHCEDPNATVQRLAILSTLAVFKDIIPGYRIRLPTAQERTQRVTKEVRMLRKYEALFLQSYQKFLQSLDVHVKNLIKETRNGQNQASKDSLGITAIRCFCTLLENAPHFNYTANIISIVVPLLNNKNPKIQKLCYKTIRDLFEYDTQGDITMKVVQLIGDFVKNRNFRVNLQMVSSFLSIKFLDALLPGDVSLNNISSLQYYSQKEKKRMTKKQYKERMRMKEIEQEMKKAEAVQSKAEKKIKQTDILRAVFVTYFRIMKKAKRSPLLPVVLEGIARYAQFISIDFVPDLLNVLETFLSPEAQDAYSIPLPIRLQCAVTAMQLSRQGGQLAEALNVDLKVLYGCLYDLLVQIPTSAIINHTKGTNYEKVFITAIELVAMDKKQLSMNRMAAFVKRLATIGLNLPVHLLLPVLCVIHRILVNYPRLQFLLDTDHPKSGVYLPQVSDPEHCNALSSSLWELQVYKQHYHPVVASYAQELFHSFREGNNPNIWDYNQQSIWDLYNGFNPADFTFNPEMQEPKMHVLRKVVTSREKRGDTRPVFITVEADQMDSPVLRRWRGIQ